MKIGLDLDDVIVDFMNTFVSFYNIRYDPSFKYKDLTSFYLWEVGVGKNKEEAVKIVDEFHNSEYFNNMPFIPGAKRGIARLNDGNKLHIITSRPLRFMRKTEDFLKKHFSKEGFELYFSSGLHKQGETKAEICKRLGLDLFLEDCLDYAKGCREKNIPVLLFDKPWNQNSNGEFNRVYSWSDALREIKKLGRENG